MILVKTNERTIVKGKIFKPDESGCSTFEVLVNGKRALALHAGMESELDLPIGQHTVQIRGVGTGYNPKSNKLNVEIKSLDDAAVIEVREDVINQVTASILYDDAIEGQLVTITCGSCGAKNKGSAGKTRPCAYCGTPITVPKQGAKQPTQEQTPPPQKAAPPPKQAPPPPPLQTPPPLQLKQKKGLAVPIIGLIVGLCTLAVFVGIPIVIIAIVVLVKRTNYNKAVDAENRLIMAHYGTPPK
ncbi:MAG: hypothetical protein FWH32_04265 [Clostridiales bacterium]|nr:hypothetical protein [Clostridiales bacterium]